jgi:hypothetical protein
MEARVAQRGEGVVEKAGDLSSRDRRLNPG